MVQRMEIKKEQKTEDHLSKEADITAQLFNLFAKYGIDNIDAVNFATNHFVLQCKLNEIDKELAIEAVNEAFNFFDSRSKPEWLDELRKSIFHHEKEGK